MQTRPALGMQELLETAAALAQDQHAAARRLPRPIDLALFMRDFEREVRAPYLPAMLVRAVPTRSPGWPGGGVSIALPPAAPAMTGTRAAAVEVADLIKRYRGARRNAVDE